MLINKRSLLAFCAIWTLSLSAVANVSVAIQESIGKEQQVASYYGVYDVESKELGLPAKSLRGPVIEQWQDQLEASASPMYKLAVLVPQLTDTWQAFSYGAMAEGKRLGMSISLFSEKSYLHFGDQKRRLRNVVAEGYNGIILSSISYKKMDSEVAAVTNSGIPIVAMANDIYAPTISGKSLVSFFDMGFKIGLHLADEMGDDSAKVAFFPGPKGAGWSDDSLKGFLQALKEQDLEDKIVVVNQDLMWGDTRQVMQQRLVRQVLENHKDISYIIGNAVAASVTADLMPGYLARHPRLKILSTYINPDVYDAIVAKKIDAAVCDFPVRQGRYATSMLVQLLDDSKGIKSYSGPFRVGPLIEVISRDTIQNYQFEDIFGPRGYAFEQAN